MHVYSCLVRSVVTYVDFIMAPRDMADIVQKQGTAVEDIGKTTTESHEKAQEGLKQVEQAAAYQPTCAVC